MAIPTITNDYQIPAVYNITIIQGDDFSRNFIFTDSTTGDVFTSYIQINEVDTVPITCTHDDDNKTINLTLSDTETATLLGNYEWYFKRVRSGYSLTLCAGKFTVKTK